MKCYAIEKKVGRSQGRSNSSARQTGRKIQIARLFAATFVVAFLCAVPTYGQEQQCLRCGANNQCQFAGFVGACACTETINGGCAVCGTCVAPKCYIECPAPVPPTAEQLQAHPWMADGSLQAKVAAYSQTLGQLLSQEQKLLKLSWCTNFRRGVGFAVPGDKSTEYKWELIPRSGGVDEYRVKRIDDGKEEKIILKQTDWIILGGDDFGDLVGRGDIASVKARLLSDRESLQGCPTHRGFRCHAG